MRDRWYADNRDLVKWSVLISLSEIHHATSILQVAFYRNEAETGVIEVDGRLLPIPQAVHAHFRQIANIVAIQAKAKLLVIEDPIEDRASYLHLVLSRLGNLPAGPGIIFLDPDTGLQPKGRAGLEHVLESELRTIWEALRLDDVLVLYQHQTNRNGQPWVDEKKLQFERSIGLPAGSAKLASGWGLARDVAFFYAARETL